MVVESAQQAIAEAGLTPDQIDLVVPHQANLRIISAACQRLDIPEEKAVVVIDRYGNTSSASIPLALADALDTDRLQPGRPRAAHRVRRRDDLGQRRPQVGRLTSDEQA